MKILFLTPNLESGGAERQMVNIALSLHDRGHNVEIVKYFPGDFYTHILKEKGIRVTDLRFSNYINRIIGIRKYIRKGGNDIVISFLETPNFLNNFAAIGGKKWNVVTGERSSQLSTFETFRGKIFCWFQRFSDKIVCNSYNAKNMWVQYCPQYEKKIAVIYNIVNLRKISSTYCPKKDDKLHIVVAASYQMLKNPINLVEALFLMKPQDRSRMKISWYGSKDGEECSQVYQKCIDLVKSYELENIISFNLPSKEIHSIMNAADMVALFSRVEGLPNAICEAMMIGKPIIMTKVSDYGNLVTDENGILCDSDCSASIKIALEKAINLDKKNLLDMGKRSNQIATELFSVDKIIDKWIN